MIDPVIKGTHGGRRKGAGHPAYKPNDGDRTTVIVMHACGKTQEQIARCLGPKPGIDLKTLTKYYAFELAQAKDKLDGICMTGIAKAMQDGQAWALCFYAKTRMGWKESSRHEVTGADGAPIQLETSAKDLLAARMAGIAARINPEPDHQPADGI